MVPAAARGVLLRPEMARAIRIGREIGKYRRSDADLEAINGDAPGQPGLKMLHGFEIVDQSLREFAPCRSAASKHGEVKRRHVRRQLFHQLAEFRQLCRLNDEAAQHPAFGTVAVAR